MRRSIFSIVIVLAVFAGTTQAQQSLRTQTRMHTPSTLFSWCGCPEAPEDLGTIVTDRPDFTEASSTVGVGVFQIEAGYTYFNNDDGGVRTTTHSWGEPLIRAGFLANWLEFRAAIFPVTQQTRNGGTTTAEGTEDLYLGLKIGLTPQHGILPEMAIMPQMTVPTGSSAFTNDLTLPGINLLYSWELDEQSSLGASTQFNRAVDGTGTEYTEWAQSVAYGRSLTEQLGFYAEYFGLYPNNAITALPEHYVNGGFTFLVNDDVQLDIRAGTGLNDAADDFFAGAGISIRSRPFSRR